MLRKASLFTLLLAISPSTFALFCPNGFNQINLGDTLAQVELQSSNYESLHGYSLKK